MELFALYLWLKLDALHAAFGAGIAVCIFLMVIGFAWWMCAIPGSGVQEGGKDWKPVAHFTRPRLFGGIAIAFAALITLVPSTKDAAILAGAYFALEAVHSPEGQKVTSLLRAKVNAYLDEQLTAAQKGAK